MPIRVVSLAQHKMLTKAADDATYAKHRGVDQELARQALIDHAKQGAPKLPERVGPPTPSERASGPVFLTSQGA